MSGTATRLRGSLSAAHNRDYRAVWIGQSASKLGTGAYVIAMAWTVFALTHSTIDLSINMVAFMVPQLLLVLFGGVIGDRLSRRAVILWCDTLGAVVTSALLVLALVHWLHFSEIVAASALLGAIAAVYGPAYRAILTDILPADDLTSGNALSAGSLNVTRIVGPLLGGLLYSLAGITLPLTVDAVSFIIAVVTMASVQLPPRQMKVKATVWSDVKEGALYCMRSRLLHYIIVLSIVANTLVIAPVAVLLPAIVRHLHGGSLTLGVLTAVQALVTVVVAVILPAAERRGYRLGVLVLFYTALGAGGLLLGVAASVPLAIVGCGALGVGYAMEVIENTMIQREIPAEMMSRTFSVMLLVSFSLLPLGYLLAGLAASAWGAPVTIEVGAVGALATCGLMSLPLLRRHEQVTGAASKK